MGLKLTQIPLSLILLLMMSNLTEVDGIRGAGAWLTQIPQISLILLLMMLNLTELGRKVVGHVRVLRVLRFPKFTQIQQDSTKKNNL